jgi:hypothetical protein
MWKQAFIAAGLTLVALASGSGVAHADPDPNDPGNQPTGPAA